MADRHPYRGAFSIIAPLINDVTAYTLSQFTYKALTLPQLRQHLMLAGVVSRDKRGNLNFQLGLSKVMTQMSANLHIGQLAGGFMQQSNIAENPAHAPHILIFQIAAVAPAQHHHRQTVFPRLQCCTEVKLCWQAAVLRIADPLAVAPQIERRVNAVENDARLAAGQPV